MNKMTALSADTPWSRVHIIVDDSNQTAAISKRQSASVSVPVTDTGYSVSKEGLPAHGSVLSAAEYKRLLALQSEMAAKMLSGELTRREILQLQMIRWAIDRAEDAQYGAVLDRMEFLASLHERLESEVSRMVAAVKK